MVVLLFVAITNAECYSTYDTMGNAVQQNEYGQDCTNTNDGMDIAYEAYYWIGGLISLAFSVYLLIKFI